MSELDENELFELYLEHCRSLQDSIEHVNYMIGSSACFEEWCEERLERLNPKEPITDVDWEARQDRIRRTGRT